DVFGQTPLHLLATAGMRLSASQLDDDSEHEEDEEDDDENLHGNGNIQAAIQGLSIGDDDDDDGDDNEVIAILKNLTKGKGNGISGIDTSELTVRLVEAGVDVDAQDRKEQTALHVAAEHGN